MAADVAPTAPARVLYTFPSAYRRLAPSELRRFILQSQSDGSQAVGLSIDAYAQWCGLARRQTLTISRALTFMGGQGVILNVVMTSQRAFRLWQAPRSLTLQMVATRGSDGPTRIL